jgi:Putative metal-binding motif
MRRRTVNKRMGRSPSGGAVLLAMLMALAVSVAPASATPVNDDYASRLPLQLGYSDTRSNVGATIEPGERLTANDPAGEGCTADGSSAADGVQMDGTLWWTFVGDGESVTVSTLGSPFDTVLAVYDETTDALVACNDDLQPYDPTRSLLEYRLSSEVIFESVTGHHYAVQVGGCARAPIGCGRTTSGDVTLRVARPPANDDRADAAPIAAGEPTSSTNIGATVESGELTTCPQNPVVPSPFAKTVWFRWHAPAIGTATFLASGFDTVLTVYRGDERTPIGCNDDAIRKSYGASSVPATSPAGPPVAVTPGDYLIQVGGYHDPGFSEVAARNGPLSVQVQFVENLDVDADGAMRPLDCDDSDPTIHPGAAEIVNNDVDENCDGIKAYDRDHDGFLAPPAGDDCDDGDAARNPSVTDVPANGIDENCDLLDAVRPLLKDTTIDGRFRYHPTFTLVEQIAVRRVPAGARITLRCRGPRRDCRFHVKRLSVRQDRASISLPRALQVRFRPLHAGTQLAVGVTKAGYTGVFRVWTMRRGRSTYRVGCLTPGGAATPC